MQAHHALGVAAMAGMIRKSLDAPEETRPFEASMGKLELVNTDVGPVGRATFQPGWTVARPTGPTSVLTSSSLPMLASNGRVSSGASRLLRIIPAIAATPKA